jgi:hypothetical protein
MNFGTGGFVIPVHLAKKEFDGAFHEASKLLPSRS